MSIIKTETNVPTLKINYLTQAMYDDALENDQINDNELYLTPSGGGEGGTPIPTADTVAEFDSSACMNSSDMSAQDISDFVDALNISTPATLVDFFYPIGSYYETSDASFNPNIAWNGTWVLEAEGLVHIGAGANYTLGDTGGEATHTLTTTEMPSHNHSFKDWWDVNIGSGAYGAHVACYTGNTSAGATNNAGGGGAHNNMQPYIVVNRWHRTA